MNYTQLLEKLYHCATSKGLKLGLENSHKLNEALSFPTRHFETIHIAGTNGKGSVSTKIAAALQAAGLKVGLYTSPHIATFRERIAINNQIISIEDVSDLLKEIFSLLDSNKIPVTFFEITTLLCFKYFANKKVDIAVIETGLGGRLDATNIIQPRLSIITSISLDHTEFLGSTLECIAREKAGIIKDRVPLIIGPHVPYSLIKEIAETKKSACLQVAGKCQDFDEENRAIAKKALEQLQVKSEAMNVGLERTPPCRMQIFDYQDINKKIKPAIVILDVAHNVDGLTRLFQAIKRKYKSATFRVVCAFSKSKDLEKCLKVISTHAQFTHLTEAKHVRIAQASELGKIWLSVCDPSSPHSIHLNEEEAIHEAIHEAASANQIVVICGTFFIMASARKILGIVEPCDIPVIY
jgi:dihydrofolate synthase / folylpolyglutamate synthase